MRKDERTKIAELLERYYLLDRIIDRSEADNLELQRVKHYLERAQEAEREAKIRANLDDYYKIPKVEKPKEAGFSFDKWLSDE